MFRQHLALLNVMGLGLSGNCSLGIELGGLRESLLNEIQDGLQPVSCHSLRPLVVDREDDGL
jgi:hypothetical protein